MTTIKKPMTLEKAIQERSKAEKIIEKLTPIIQAQARDYILMVLRAHEDEPFSPDEITKMITTECGIQFKVVDVCSVVEDMHYHGKITREPGFENRYKVLGNY